jgi:C4-dicarboxylate transporter DctM subunit
MHAIVIFLMLLLLCCGVPIAVVVGLGAVLLIKFAAQIPLVALPQVMFNGIDSTLLLAVLFFIFAGNIMSEGVLARRLINVGKVLLGWQRGGLAVSGVLACVFFAAVSGSSTATVIAVGTVMIPALIKEGYHQNFSTGLITSAGSLGILIPPSVPMIIWALVMNVSITSQFLAGVMPGILIACMMIGYTYYLARVNGWKRGERVGLSEVLQALREGIWALSLPIVVLGGIYSGVFTPTEAAAVAVIYALVIELFIHRSLRLPDLTKVTLNSVLVGSALLFIISAASTLSWYLSFMQVPLQAAEFLDKVIEQRWIFLLLCNVFLIFLGCFVDLVSAMLILGPILAPILAKFNIDPLHFGIIMIVNCEIGFLTPPMGLNLFVASTITKRDIVSVARSTAPFLALFIVALMLITYLPGISLWLTEVMGT